MLYKNEAPLIFSLRTRSALEFVQPIIFFKFISNSFQIYFKLLPSYLQGHIFMFMRCLKVWECENEHVWAHDKDAKESTNQGGHFLDSHVFSWSYVGSKSNLHPRTEISSICVANHEIVYFKMKIKYLKLLISFASMNCHAIIISKLIMLFFLQELNILFAAVSN